MPPRSAPPSIVVASYQLRSSCGPGGWRWTRTPRGPPSGSAAATTIVMLPRPSPDLPPDPGTTGAPIGRRARRRHRLRDCQAGTIGWGRGGGEPKASAPRTPCFVRAGCTPGRRPHGADHRPVAPTCRVAPDMDGARTSGSNRATPRVGARKPRDATCWPIPRLRLALWRTLSEADQPQFCVDRDPRRHPTVIEPGMAGGEEGLGFDRGHRPDAPHSVPSRVWANLTTHTHQFRIKRETHRRHHVSLAFARCRVSRPVLPGCGHHAPNGTP